MIPAQNIVAWGNVVPWADPRQVEQDLIIRAAPWSRCSRTRCCEVRYLALSGKATSRAQAQERMFAKLARSRFLLDMRPLLPAVRAEALTDESTAESFRHVFTTLVDRLPGEP